VGPPVRTRNFLSFVLLFYLPFGIILVRIDPSWNEPFSPHTPPFKIVGLVHSAKLGPFYPLFPPFLALPSPRTSGLLVCPTLIVFAGIFRSALNSLPSGLFSRPLVPAIVQPHSLRYLYRRPLYFGRSSSPSPTSVPPPLRHQDAGPCPFRRSRHFFFVCSCNRLCIPPTFFLFTKLTFRPLHDFLFHQDLPRF